MPSKKAQEAIKGKKELLEKFDLGVAVKGKGLSEEAVENLEHLRRNFEGAIVRDE